MRKYIRKILRAEAKRKGFRPSKWVHLEWQRLQVKKCGAKRREINQAKGTQPKSKWRNRINSQLV